ncbi:hypothetical protein OOJ09_18935 [Mesorhizobium qingshengii]|uniref:Uncharacterized protein n=1 Tax=Mesorhizobium qingshengii TaxID=1165689 RepID=A0ABT4QXE9_9HYPH|nr:hypothetical protein [Mesorhizobium qingshengii]MCZ8546269.1 hypothetical protein [Mesorhizobium qingshengii]
MKAIAVDLAQNKLALAQQAFARLQTANSYEAAEQAWADFLVAVGAVYSKLEQGAKGVGKSDAWFGRQKHQRKRDALLRYLHFARDSDVHGIEHITHRDVPTIDGKPIVFRPEHFGKEIPLQIRKVDPVTNAPVGDPLDGTLRGPNIVLRTVTNQKFGDRCDVPTEHQGQAIEVPTPQLIAELGIKYMIAMVAEARSLVVQDT